MSFRVPEEKRVRKAGRWSSDETHGNNGLFEFRLKSGRKVLAMASDGMGWEHVSVSLLGWDKCPSWEEMCEVKAVFWSEDDCVVEYHPPKGEYVNRHKHCLHLWKPVGAEMPRPPKELVG